MNGAALPLRSRLPWAGSAYAPALAAHWADQTPDRYKKLWDAAVTRHDEGGVRFTQEFRWPTQYYLGYDDTYSQRSARAADKLLC